MKLSILLLSLVFSALGYTKPNSTHKFPLYSNKTSNNLVSQCPEQKFCYDEDGEAYPVGYEEFVTCETDPNSQATIIVKFCQQKSDGSVQWSDNLAKYSPDGC